MAASMLGCDDADVGGSNNGNNSPNDHVGIGLGRRRTSLESLTVRPRERKPSETVPVDLLRVAVKRIGLEGLKEEEISRLMREVDLVKRLSHPSIVKYEGMALDENNLSIVLECVIPFLLSYTGGVPLPACLLLLRILLGTY